ncbi:Serine-threonine protein kinase, plant-type, putative [Theobroma cacao]|uniref:Serine-threonine protein kinase, plant-type, putative n=1 Tax=Theobroma cacao TaxID=3641 RepID=A0A061E899_THECC|nr:Serine-threonine protein kinase, plant-type, putative [Theobroma cacao]
MTLLNYLNLSYNNLSGQIPSSNQLQTMADPSIYQGNPRLCGPPLSANCSISGDGDGFPKDEDDEDDDGSKNLGMYISAVLGFVIGFWAVFGTLVIKKSVRRAYFRYLENMKDKLFVLIAVKLARLQRKMEVQRT